MPVHTLWIEGSAKMASPGFNSLTQADAENVAMHLAELGDAWEQQTFRDCDGLLHLLLEKQVAGGALEWLIYCDKGRFRVSRITDNRLNPLGSWPTIDAALTWVTAHPDEERAGLLHF